MNGLYTRVSHEALSYSMFANGIAPAVVVGGNLDYMKQIWEHIKPCEAYMSGATLAPYTALHFSENTLNWYANAGGNDACQAYIKNVFGFFQALLETHLPVAIITDDDLTDPGSLVPYASIVLPNTACLSDQQAAALTAYVQGGGGLVASFETGVFDENGMRREKPALEDLLGVKQGSIKADVDWVLDLNPSNLAHEIVNIPEIINGGNPSQGVLERQPYVTLYTGNYNRDARSVKTTALPGVQSVRLRQGSTEEGYNLLHTRTVGSGRVAYFPPDISHGYFLFNHPVSRLIIERTVRWSAGKPPFMETNAPMAVQTVCFRKGNDLLVHLVNDNSSFGRATAPNLENFGRFRDEVLPVYDVKIAVKGDYSKAVQLPEGKDLTVQENDGISEVTVPRVDIHTMIVFSQ